MVDSQWIIETTDETFEQDVIVRSNDLPVVVDFWSETCAPCKALAPTLEKLANDFDGKFLLVKANTEQTPSAATYCGVQSIPAVFGFRDGEPIDMFVGLLGEDQVKSWLERLLPSEAEQLVAEARALESNDPQAAEANYRKAIELDGELAKAKIGLAALLLAQDQSDECRELIAALEARGYLEPEAQKLQAKLKVSGKAADVGSIAECRAAIETEPENQALRLQLAEALAAVGQYEESLQTALSLVENHKQDFGEPARKMMVDIFQLLPDDSELTSNYRRKLSAALY
jgi:putative thioredoxin